MGSTARTWALPIAVLAVAALSGGWRSIVSRVVPEPYLDEVFHVRQAQVYCSGAFSEWDPKITTPPGLYLISYLVYRITGDCDISTLRSLNSGAVCLICLLSYDILRNRRRSTENLALRSSNVRTVIYDAHSSLNISLFPPLFFFSALYYTDVLSTLCVLQSYNGLLQWQAGEQSRLASALRSVAIGVVALFFRQTNIFWVALFPAGLAVVHTLKQAQPKSGAPLQPSSITEIVRSSWDQGLIHDCAIEDASLYNCFTLLISTALAAVRTPFKVIQVLLPYLFLLGAFGGFVAWNRGVVLGDKSNHVATLHLPQILYIWPYIIFFSLPLAISHLLVPLVEQLPEGRVRSFCQGHFVGSSQLQVPRLISVALFTVSAIAATRYNFIIHPFTLADNRHYVFYVFRILRQHPAVKYLAAPVYVFCGWLTFQTLVHQELLGQSQTRGSPSERRKGPTRNDELRRSSCQLSFVVIWLATTTLSVVTAPLVEPRYFIIPWIMWRLHVPHATTSSRDKSRSKSFVQGYDLRLMSETLWLLAINTATAYMFLYRGFSWPQEPGKIQRFMW